MSTGETSYWNRVMATAAVYIAAAWAAAEALLTVIDRFGLPPWWGALITALFVAGLPVTVYLVWRTAGVERKASATAILASLLFLLVATASLFWFTRPPPLPQASAVAIVPCEFQGEGEYAYRAEGLAEDVHARLSRVDAVKLSSWNSSLFVRDKGYEPERIADVLQVDRLVQCRVKSTADRIELSARVIDLAANSVLWDHDYAFVATDLGKVVTEFAGTLLNVLGTTAEAAELGRVRDLGTFSPEAYDLRLQAQSLGPNELDRAERLLEQALAIDPNYAQALVDRALIFLERFTSREFDDPSILLEWGGKAREMAQRALELDSGVWNARQILARVCRLMDIYSAESCPVEEAERLGREECEVRGDTAEGWACRYHRLSGEEDDEALAHWLELEPTSIEANMSYMYALWVEQQNRGEALAVFDTVRALDPEDHRPYGLISNILRRDGRLDEVLAWRYGSVEDALPEGAPWSLARLGTDYLNLGMYDQALEIGLKTWETRRASAMHFLPQLWVYDGESERAIEANEWLVQTLEQLTGGATPGADYKFSVPNFYAGILRDYERARAGYEAVLAGQELTDACPDERCVIDNALHLAQIAVALHQDAEAAGWLQMAQEAAVREEPSDLMQIALLTAQGHRSEAIDRLREAVFTWRLLDDDGYDLAFPLLLLEQWALFDPLRDLAEFQRLMADYAAYLEPLRERALEAHRTGGWEALRQRTYAWARQADS
jgi:TolB-like protein